MSIMDMHTVKRRIMKSKVIDTIIGEGPISEDRILPTRTFNSSQRHSNTTLEDLSEIWGISVQQAKLTLDATTQHHVRSAIMPLLRRYRTDRMYEPLRLRCTVATDTMDPRTDGTNSLQYCQVFGTKQMFAEAYPIRRKADCHEALRKFIIEYEVPDMMIMDRSKEQSSKGAKFQAILRKNNIASKTTLFSLLYSMKEPSTPMKMIQWN